MYGIARNTNPDFPDRKWAIFRLDGYEHVPFDYPGQLPRNAELIDEPYIVSDQDAERILARLQQAPISTAKDFLGYLQRFYDKPFLSIYMDNLEVLRQVPGTTPRTVAYYTVYPEDCGALVFRIAFLKKRIIASTGDGKLTATCPFDSNRREVRWELVEQ